MQVESTGHWWVPELVAFFTITLQAAPTGLNLEQGWCRECGRKQGAGEVRFVMSPRQACCHMAHLGLRHGRYSVPQKGCMKCTKTVPAPWWRSLVCDRAGVTSAAAALRHIAVAAGLQQGAAGCVGMAGEGGWGGSMGGCGAALRAAAMQQQLLPRSCHVAASPHLAADVTQLLAVVWRAVLSVTITILLRITGPACGAADLRALCLNLM